MRRFAVLGLALAILAGLWWLLERYEIRGLDQVQVVPRGREAAELAEGPTAVAVRRRTEPVIRIATFNIRDFGPAKLRRDDILDRLAEIIGHFDLVAVQEIQSAHQDPIPPLLERLHRAGKPFQYVLGPRVGRTHQKEQFAFLFDASSLEVDRTQVYTVEDPDDLLHREPLVAWFRVRGPPPEAAFTFTVVNVHTDPDEVIQEVQALAQVFRAVRDDGRGEDDVIMLGDFNADDGTLQLLQGIPGIRWAIVGTPTNTRQTAQYDNIVFQLPATAEYTGRAGVMDFMRQWNLSLQAALEISDHLPVWAEFSIYEGGVPAVALRPTAPPSSLDDSPLQP